MHAIHSYTAKWIQLCKQYNLPSWKLYNHAIDTIMPPRLRLGEEIQHKCSLFSDLANTLSRGDSRGCISPLIEIYLHCQDFVYHWLRFDSFLAAFTWNGWGLWVYFSKVFGLFCSCLMTFGFDHAIHSISHQACPSSLIAYVTFPRICYQIQELLHDMDNDYYWYAYILDTIIFQ